MFISIGIDENGKPYVSTSDSSDDHPRRTRPHKGHNILSAPDTYTVIDIETTGLDSRYCEIVEMSALRYAGGNLSSSFSTLVKPAEPIDEFITELTGITNDMVSDAPSISAAIKQFYDFIGSDILVGYNVNFDINFIYDVLQETHGIDFTNDFVDVMRLAKIISSLLLQIIIKQSLRLTAPMLTAKRATLYTKIYYLIYLHNMEALRLLKLPAPAASYTLKILPPPLITLTLATLFTVNCVYLLALLKRCSVKTLCSSL